MITVVSWLWQQAGGMSEFTADHVNTWAAMIRRNLHQPHRLVCVTDTPDGIDPGVEIIPPFQEFEDFEAGSWGQGRPRCWRRMVIFRPDAARWFGPRFVSMDLDCVIGAPLDPLFNRPEELVLLRGTKQFWRPYNGSMVLLTAGARPQVYKLLTEDNARIASSRYMGSDQAWITFCLGPREAVWNYDEGVRFWNANKLVQPGARIVFTAGQRKPWHATAIDPWIAKHYRLYIRGDENGTEHARVYG